MTQGHGVTGVGTGPIPSQNVYSALSGIKGTRALPRIEGDASTWLLLVSVSLSSEFMYTCANYGPRSPVVDHLFCGFLGTRVRLNRIDISNRNE